MSVRTDLALESARQLSLTKDIEGVSRNIDIAEDAELEICDITIETEEAARTIGKPVGRYITVRSVSAPFDCYCEHFEKRVDIISQQILKLCRDPQKILAVGLGNRQITPDAVGPLCADRIFATRHIKSLSDEIDSSGLSDLSVIQTGVMGQTGIEASEQVKAICGKISPDLVIAVDALACSEMEHLGSAIQLCNTGISPGSGVENARKELSPATLGTACIAVGTPTVVDLSTAAEHLFGAPVPVTRRTMMVTPRNVDKLVMNSAKYIAYAINRAFHPDLSLEDIQSLVE